MNTKASKRGGIEPKKKDAAAREETSHNSHSFHKSFVLNRLISGEDSASHIYYLSPAVELKPSLAILFTLFWLSFEVKKQMREERGSRRRRRIG